MPYPPVSRPVRADDIAHLPPSENGRRLSSWLLVGLHFIPGLAVLGAYLGLAGIARRFDAPPALALNAGFCSSGSPYSFSYCGGWRGAWVMRPCGTPSVGRAERAGGCFCLRF
ncbi:hypothetical protein GWO14_10745 [candidate division KSB1 bacterium]|nr:hypothetical protein [candidate division KSB1 bacterium]